MFRIRRSRSTGFSGHVRPEYAEVLDANLFNALADVQTIADDWLADYNEYRPHESLGNRPVLAVLSG
jgi:transposase InsO family protein